MPELDFKGKEFVRNHHLTVPYRPLVAHADKSVGDVDLNGNLIIHGDNLDALKALLPMYAGKVDCIFIDPPYNTGNEGWCYNDNVNSPLMKEWFSQNPIGIDDTMRHEKWCAMMWPRLRLLHELLSDTGALWITLDDNESHRARIMLDEIFGDQNFVAEIAWQARKSVQNDTDISKNSLNLIHCYAKDRRQTNRRLKESNAASWMNEPGFVIQPIGINASRYKYFDEARQKRYKADPFDAPGIRPNLTYSIVNPNTGIEYLPPQGRHWGKGEDEYLRLLADDRIEFGRKGTSGPQLKVFEDEKVDFGEVPTVWWDFEFTATVASDELRSILPNEKFETPKPIGLLKYIIERTLRRGEGIVLDAFAGSGTTGHAVLDLNATDGRDRKFILVELLDYAERITAARVRNAITGYAGFGVSSTVRYEKKLSWQALQKWEKYRTEAENTKITYEGNHDRMSITVDNGVLKVIGENDVKDTIPGLGGSFTYCTLGQPLNLEKILFTEDLPERESLGDWLLYLASGTQDKDAKPTHLGELKDIFLAKQGNTYYWFIYQRDRNFLGGPDAALTLSLAEKINRIDPEATHRVFSPAKYVSQKVIRDKGWNIEHAPIPMALFNRGI
jgi:adenine-specific DNA-methyltransferase